MTELSAVANKSQRAGDSSGTKTQNDSDIEEIVIDLGKTAGALTPATHGVADPSQSGAKAGAKTGETSWAEYEESLLIEDATPSGGHKRTAEAAGFDASSGGQGGDASRPRVEGHNTATGATPPGRDSLSSPNFEKLGINDMSTPKQQEDWEKEKELIRSARKLDLNDRKS